MKDKGETSTTDLIILFFFLFIILNISFAVTCMLISDDTESNMKLIKEFAISTGSLIGINIVGLILIECFERIEKTKRNVSGKVIFRYCGAAADTTCSRLQLLRWIFVRGNPFFEEKDCFSRGDVKRRMGAFCELGTGYGNEISYFV